MILQLRSRRLDLATPRVMGVLNVTPDSFSDGGRHLDTEAALARAREMAGEGAAIIDVGGESTRPGAAPVGVQEELDRVVPVIERLARELDVVISVDTMKPAVMQAACAAGAELINDVLALRAPGALSVAASSGAAVCLMHMQGEPRSMQVAPAYGAVVTEVREFLAERMVVAQRAGIARERLLVDPGFGFGKTLAHNLALLGQLPAFHDLAVPLLVGLSRKSMFQQLLGRPLAQRLPASVAAATLAVWQGAAIVRAHDVAATVDALRLAAAVQQSRGSQ
ncbi:MAG TPA: dihydropteroate synthase [Solimonas sp.]|nr:dihydropteroate synthase [Solimonas sp.]